MLDQKTIDIVKSTVPVLKEYCLEITTTFYKNMFEENKDIEHMFDMSRQISGEQPKALAMAILLAAQNIDNFSAITPEVNKIAESHCNTNVKPEHYPIVGKNLLRAIKEILKDDATDEIIEAWGKAYEVLAEVLINREAEIYNLRMNK